MDKKLIETMDENGIIQAVENAVDMYNSDARLESGYMFNMPETIKLIDLYSMSKFSSGDTDSKGYKKYFMNIINPMIDNAAKNIDIDCSNIVIKPTRTKYRIAAMVYNYKLQEYMGNIHFGIVLNQIDFDAPTYGSVILKYVDGKIVQVPLKYCMFDPTVTNVQDDYNIHSDFLMEIMYKNLREVEDKRGVWIDKNIDLIYDKVLKLMGMGPSKTPNIRILECYMTLPKKLFYGDKVKGYDLYKLYVTLDADDESRPLGLKKVLYWTETKWPKYKKFDYKRKVGRSMGFGLVEGAFDAQERVNENANAIARMQRTLSKQAYQTRDNQLGGTMIDDLEDNEVIFSRSEISPIAVEDRDAGQLINESERWKNSNMENSNATDIGMGKTMPSDTAYRTVQTLAGESSKYFDIVRQNEGLFLDEVFTEWILPDFEKDIKDNPDIDIVDMDLWYIIAEERINNKIKEASLKMWRNTGRWPSAEEIESVKSTYLNREVTDPVLEIVEDYFSFDKKLFVDTSGNRYKAQRAVDSKINALTQIAQNPNILTDPIAYNLFSSIMEDVGVSLDDLRAPSGMNFKASLAQNMQAGQQTQGTSSAQVPSPAQAGRSQALGAGGTESIQVNNQINAQR